MVSRSDRARPTVYVDLETHSTVDLVSRGIDLYAPAASILLCCWALDDGPVQTWHPWSGEPFPTWPADATFVAHNARFERLVLRYYGLGPRRWRCTAVQARAHGLPSSLADAAAAAGIPQQKQADGKELIGIFCGPHDCPAPTHEAWARFQSYCVADVEACRGLYKTLPKHNYPGLTEAAYALDQRINDRGFLVDVEFIERADELVQEQRAYMDQRVSELTFGLVRTARGRGLQVIFGVDDLKKTTLTGLQFQDETLAELLDIRRQASLASLSKYAAMLARVGPDGRIRGEYWFNGAGRTGRWTSNGVQMQNLPRSDGEQAVSIVRRVKDNGSATLKELSIALRSAVIAPPGKLLSVVDYSSIEARVRAWCAGETWLVDTFAAGGDVYKTTYSKMFGAPCVTKDQRFVGKIAELACGYAGGVGALVSMCIGNGASYADLASAATAAADQSLLDAADRSMRFAAERGLATPDTATVRGVEIPWRIAHGLHVAKHAWRRANARTVELWYGLEDAALAAVDQPRTFVPVGRVTLEYRAPFLLIRLPSGRLLTYNKPIVVLNEEFEKRELRFYDYRYGRKPLTGGLMTENICQAISWDLLVNAMPQVEAVAPIIMHTHDEIVCEVDEPMHEQIAKLMCDGPVWAAGLPLAAEGNSGPRYAK